MKDQPLIFANLHPPTPKGYGGTSKCQMKSQCSKKRSEQWSEIKTSKLSRKCEIRKTGKMNNRTLIALISWMLKNLTTHPHWLTLKSKSRRQNSVGLFNIPALREFNPALRDWTLGVGLWRNNEQVHFSFEAFSLYAKQSFPHWLLLLISGESCNLRPKSLSFSSFRGFVIIFSL